MAQSSEGKKAVRKTSKKRAKPDIIREEEMKKHKSKGVIRTSE